MKKFAAIILGCFIAVVGYAQPGDLPVNAAPGKCYAKCLIPDQYETVTEVIGAAGSGINEKVLIVEPEYETVTQRVMVKPASIDYVTNPGQYETITEQVMVKPPTTDLVVVPAEYETVTEQVMVEPPSKQLVVTPGEYATVSGSNMYGVGADGSSIDLGDLLDPSNPNNPNNPSSPFNPNNPNGLYNPNNPNSPFNPNSPYNPENPTGMWSPTNPDSPFNPAYANVGSGMDANAMSEMELLKMSGVGLVLPYLVQEASVRMERIPVETGRTERIEVRPATTRWEKRMADRNCLSANPEDCLVWCLVEVPAEFQTVRLTGAASCPSGYILSGDNETSDREYCVRLVPIAAQFGARTVLSKAPSVSEQELPGRFETITKQKVVKAASVQEVTKPAEYKTLTKRVLKTPPTVMKKVAPAEYKTITRKVRKGLGGANYTDASGTILIKTSGTGNGNMATGSDTETMTGEDAYASDPFQVVNPATGYLNNPAYEGAASGTNSYTSTGASGYNLKMPAGLPANFYTAGCPVGYNFDLADNVCKKRVSASNSSGRAQTITRKKLVKAGGFSEWREILCTNKITSYTIRQIQSALLNFGYDPGVVDNQMGMKTKAALTKFQKDRGLPVGNLDFETLKALGIEY